MVRGRANADAATSRNVSGGTGDASVPTISSTSATPSQGASSSTQPIQAESAKEIADPQSNTSSLTGSSPEPPDPEAERMAAAGHGPTAYRQRGNHTRLRPDLDISRPYRGPAFTADSDEDDEDEDYDEDGRSDHEDDVGDDGSESVNKLAGEDSPLNANTPRSNNTFGDVDSPASNQTPASNSTRGSFHTATSNNIPADNYTSTNHSPPTAQAYPPPPPSPGLIYADTTTPAETGGRTHGERRAYWHLMNPYPMTNYCQHTDWCDCLMHAGIEKGVRIPHLGEYALHMWSEQGPVSWERSTRGRG